MSVKIAISQKPPVLLDLEAFITKAVDIISEAASNSAQ